MNRRNQILAGLLALQIVVMAVVFWPRSRAAGSGQPLFAGLQPETVTQLKVTGPDGKSVQLAKSGDTWVVAGTDDYPVLSDKVPPLLTQIAGLKAERPVTTTAASMKRLKVAPDDYERLVELQLADGTQHRLYLGTAPSYGATHVRADDQAEVYLASGLNSSDFADTASSWVDRAYLTIPQDEVTGLVLVNGDGKLEFSKSGQAWSLAGLGASETLDQTAVQGLLNRVSPLTLLAPLGKDDKAEYGMAAPGAVLTVTTKGEGGDKTYTLTVGAQDPADKSYVVHSSESPYYVRVSEYAVKDLVTKGRAGFLVQPTAVPTASPAP